MSAAARRRISEAVKARWAARTKSNRATQAASGKGKKATRSQHMSVAGRKRLSALMRVRWAERKKAASGAAR